MATKKNEKVDWKIYGLAKSLVECEYLGVFTKRTTKMETIEDLHAEIERMYHQLKGTK